ncbi:MAG: hypothetical protein RR376_10455 [Janthinobacterium sp.]
MESESCLNLPASGRQWRAGPVSAMARGQAVRRLLLMYQMVKAVSNHGQPCYYLPRWHRCVRVHGVVFKQTTPFFARATVRRVIVPQAYLFGWKKRWFMRGTESAAFF